MEIIRAGQRPDPRRRWEVSTQPDEMLVLLRDACKSRPLPANKLRIFASRCARQRGSDVYIHDLLSALGSVASLDVTPDSLASLARLRSKYLTVADASTRQLDTPERRAAARHLAAFNTLLDNPLDAAVGASLYMLRYGASDEADLRAMREEQVRWLRDLFEAPPALRPETDPPIDRPWLDMGTRNSGKAEFLRALCRYARELIARDPWVPVPQASCNYGFGFDARPLPIGALVYLWDHWYAMRGRCPACGGDVRGYVIGGELSDGGALGCCLVCERSLVRHIGNVGVVAELVRPILGSTPYYIESIGVWGSHPGDERSFSEALAALAIERAISNGDSKSVRG